MEKIGDRIQFWREDDALRIVIAGRLDSWKQIILSVWLVAWAVSIVVFAMQMGGEFTRDERLFFFILVLFMLYFFFRLGKVWLWRKHGKELISITKDKLTIKRDRRSYGKAYSYVLDNIKELGMVKHKENSFKAELEKSFWVVGGEVLGFSSLGTKVKFAMQLNEEDAQQLAGLIKNEIKTKKALLAN